MNNEAALSGPEVRSIMRREGVTIRCLAEVVAVDFKYKRPQMKFVRNWRNKGVKPGIFRWEFNDWIAKAKGLQS